MIVIAFSFFSLTLQMVAIISYTYMVLSKLSSQESESISCPMEHLVSPCLSQLVPCSLQWGFDEVQLVAEESFATRSCSLRSFEGISGFLEY